MSEQIKNGWTEELMTMTSFGTQGGKMKDWSKVERHDLYEYSTGIHEPHPVVTASDFDYLLTELRETRRALENEYQAHHHLYAYQQFELDQEIESLIFEARTELQAEGKP